MIDFLVRRLIKNCDNINDPAVRAHYGTVAGGIGIFLNLCLFAAKFTAGLLTASIAIICCHACGISYGRRACRS